MSYSRIWRDTFAGGALGAGGGAITGGAIGASVGTVAGGPGGTIIIGGAGMATGAIAGGMVGSAAAFAHDWNLMYSGTPKDAQKEHGKTNKPKEIDRIDKPHNQPGSQWHAHDKKGAINQDGTVKEGKPKFSKGTLDWLRDRGWNV